MKLVEALEPSWLSNFTQKDGEHSIVAIQSTSGEHKLICLADVHSIPHIPEELKQWDVVSEIKTNEELISWNISH